MPAFKSQPGFSLIEGVVVIAVILLTAAAAFYVYTNQTNENDDSTFQSQPAVADDVVDAPEIRDTSDLEAAEKALEANDPALSQEDEAQLDKELADI